MLTVGLNLKPRVKKGFDSDAQAFFTRVTVAGGTLSATEKLATNQLVLDLKSAGIWTSMKAIYPMVGASASACAQNLKSSSFTGTFSSGWTFASTGVTPNGTSAYFDTALNTLTNLTTTSTHLSIYVRNNILNAEYDLANASNIGLTTDPTYIITRYSGNLTFGGIADTTYGTNTASTDSRGFSSVATNGTRLQNLYKNGISIVNSTGSGSFANNNLYLGAANGGGTALYFSTKQYAFCSIGNGLNATNQSNFYTAVQTFNQTLSRQVGAQIVSDADAQAYINRVYAAGGTLTNTEATAVNQLTIDMKASNVWTSMKAIYPMIGSSAAACAQNLKSSSFTGTFSSGWTFASTGVTPNGTSAYFNTTLIPSTSLSVNSTHQSLYLNTNNVATSADPVDMGSFNSSTQRITLVQSSLAALSFASANLATLISTTQATRQGFGITSKTSATLTTLYKNGISVATGNSGGTLPSFNVYIGNLNFINTPYASGYTNNKIAFSSIGDSLDNTQASALYTNVQTFNTTLNRNV
jgi:hypothetical protein